MKTLIKAGLIALFVMMSCVPAFAESTSETTMDLKKTAHWTNDEKTEADVEIVTHVNETITTIPPNVLFVGSLCNVHDMQETTIPESLNTIAKEANVKYYAFNKYTGTPTYQGTIAKGGTFPTDEVTLEGNNHQCYEGFIKALYDELITQKKEYDYIILEFDSWLLDGVGYTPQGELVKYEHVKAQDDAVANVLKEYYENDQVIWVTNQTGDDDYETWKGKYGQPTLGNPWPILNPAAYLSGSTDASDYTLLESYLQTDYMNLEALKEFLEETLIFGYKEEINDKIINDFSVDSWEFFIKDEDEWVELDSVDSWNLQDVSISENGLSGDTTTKTIIHLTSDGSFKNNSVYGTNYINPNNGKVKAKIHTTSQDLEQEADLENLLSWEAYKITTTVENGTITENPIVPERGSKKIEYSPNEGYEMGYVEVDGERLENPGTEYTFNNVNEDHTIKVVYEKLPALQVDKTTDKSVYLAGDEVVYTVRGRQTVADAIARNVKITDILDEGLILDPDSFTGDVTVVSADDHSFEINIPTLEDEIVFTYRAKTPNYGIEGLKNNIKAIADNAPNEAEDSVSVDVEVPVPTLEVEKLSDKLKYIAGDDITYTVTVRQTTDNAEAKNVVITDTLAPGLVLDRDSITGNVVVEETTDNSLKVSIASLTDTVTFSYKAKTPKANAIGLENDVKVTSDNADNEPEASIAVDVVAPALEVEKVTDKTRYEAGEDIVYTVTVKQTVEDAEARNVKVEDTLDEGLVLDKESVKGDVTVESVTDNSLVVTIPVVTDEVTFSYRAKAPDHDVEGISNSVKVTSDNATNEPEISVPVDIYMPVLEVEKTTDKTVYEPEEDVTYTVTVRQTVDGAEAKNVVITDTLDNGLVLDQNSFEGVTVEESDEHSFKAVIPSLTDTVTFTYKAKAPNYGAHALKNSIKVTSDNGKNEPEISVPIDINAPVPVLTIDKTTDKEKYNAGDDITYTVTVKQTVENAEAKNVVITDTLSEDLVLYQDSFEGVTVEESDEHSFKVVIPSLTDEITFTYKAKTPNKDAEGLTNNVKATADNIEDDPEISVPVDVYAPALEVTKTTDKDEYTSGEDITYTVTVKQTVENAEAKNVKITDTLDDGLILDQESFEGITADSSDEHSFEVTIPSLTDEITFTYKAKTPDRTVKGIKNNIKASADNSKNEAEVSVPVDVNGPVLEVEKTADKTLYLPGEYVTYRVRVRQTREGAVAKNVRITDTLDDGLTLDPDSIELEEEQEDPGDDEDEDDEDDDEDDEDDDEGGDEDEGEDEGEDEDEGGFTSLGRKTALQEDDLDDEEDLDEDEVQDTEDETQDTEDETQDEEQPDIIINDTDDSSLDVTIPEVEDEKTIKYRAKTPEHDAEGLSNGVVVSADNVEGEAEDSVDVDVSAVTPTIDISVSDEKPNYGDVVTYTIVVTKPQKRVALKNAVITDELPENLEFQEESFEFSEEEATGEYDDGTITVDMPDIEDTFTMEFDAEVKAKSGKITNKAVLSGDNFDDSEDEVDITVTPPEPTIKKTVNKKKVTVGQKVKYTVRIKSDIPLTDAVITDISDKGIKIDKGSVECDGGEAVLGNDLVVEVDDDATDIKLTYTAKITKAGTLKNTAKLKAKNLEKEYKSSAKVKGVRKPVKRRKNQTGDDIMNLFVILVAAIGIGTAAYMNRRRQ